MTLQDEVESFFTKATQILFVEQEVGVNDEYGMPLIFLLYNKHYFDKYVKSDIDLKILNYFNNKKVFFQIILEQETQSFKVSIIDKLTGDAINMANVIFNPSIYNFITMTNEDDNVMLLAACNYNNEMLFIPSQLDAIHVRLEGYSVLHT